MLFEQKKKKGVVVYFIDRKQVSKEVHDAALAKAVGNTTLAEGIAEKTAGRKRHEKRGYPIKSFAMAVTRSRIPEAMERDAKLGVPTEYTKGGRPILRDPQHRKQYLKAHGLHDRNSYNGY